MSVPVPLGVRFFSVINAGERWVTRWVDDLTFRSVVPGGFASATITLRVPRNAGSAARPDPLGFSSLVDLFQRIQIIDLRTLEVAWEGRVEDPARQVEPDTWQIGALGSMVAATDIQRPVFYVDSDAGNWVGAGAYNRFGDVAPDDLPVWTNQRGVGGELDSTHRGSDPGTGWVAGDLDLGYIYSWRWNSHGYDQSIARFTTTHNGSGPSGQELNFSLVVGIAASASVDATGVEVTADTTKTNVIGTDFTDANTRYIVLGARRDSGTGDYFIPDGSNTILYTKWSNPKVVGMRQNRFGTKLTTAASYPGSYVTVAQVVEDVIGRFLVGGWYELGVNTPWPGSVRAADVYIDSSDTTQILHLIYPDGATAADILNDLVDQVQTNAYWALWESAWGAGTPNTSFGSASGFRFEFATWPKNWGYVASSQDGFEGQPNGDGVYNFIFYRYPDNGDSNEPHVSTTWRGGESMAPELLSGGFTRAITVNKTDPTDGGTAGVLAETTIDSHKKVKNAGTLTVRRPIQFYDAGVNSNSGAGRMLDPWMLRPGKLIRITDLPPRAGSTDMSYGNTAPTTALDGTIFRVVATEYSSSDNACRLELDQVANWQLPTQITKSGGPAKTIRIQ